MPPLDPVQRSQVFGVTLGSNVESMAVITAEEMAMSPHDIPKTPSRPPSNAENAMAANARSRDRQGKAEDRARHERHVDMISNARQNSPEDEGAANQGMGETQAPSSGPSARP